MVSWEGSRGGLLSTSYVTLTPAEKYEEAITLATPHGLSCLWQVTQKHVRSDISRTCLRLSVVW